MMIAGERKKKVVKVKGAVVRDCAVDSRSSRRSLTSRNGAVLMSVCPRIRGVAVAMTDWCGAVRSLAAKMTTKMMVKKS